MKWILLFVFSLYTGFTLAQVQIKGKVVNKEGQAIFAANVFSKSSPQNGTATDFDGNFLLKVTNINDSIIVSSIGFKTQTVVIATLNNAIPLTVTLSEDNQLLSEVIVTAQDPISQKYSVTKLKKIDIYFNPIAQADPLKAVTILPASTTTDETANPSLRGSSSDRTRVMLNGVPIYTPVRSSQLNNEGFFSLFNTELIHKQYIYASNPPLTYGNTSAGLVEIQTLKNLSYNQQQLSFSIGSLGIFVSQQLKNKETNFLQVYGNIQHSNAFIAIQKKYLPHLKSFNTKDIGVNFHHNIGKSLEFNSFNYCINEHFKVNHSNLNYTGEANANKQRFFSVNNLHYYTTKGVFSMNSGINISKQHFNYGNIRSNKKINQIYTSLNFKGRFSENLDFQTGISLDFHQNHSRDTIPKYFFALAPHAPSKASNIKISNHICEAYIYSNWKMNNHLSFSAGVRSNLPTQNQQYYLNVQLGLQYNINDSNNILLSGGSYHSYATPNFYNQNFNLLSSKQIACDYTYTAKNVKAKAAAYYKKEKGQQALNSYFTIDKIQTLGFETYIEYSFARHLKVIASNTFINQTLYQNENHFHGKYDFNYLTKIALQYNNIKLFTASISYMGHPGSYYTPLQNVMKKPQFNHTIPIFDTNINSRQYAKYNKVDFGINRYTPLKNGAIIPFLSISNILNIKNENSVYYNEDYSKKQFDYYSHRVFYFGVIWEL